MEKIKAAEINVLASDSEIDRGKIGQ